MIRIAVLPILLALSVTAFAVPRDQVHTRSFRRDNPCPSTQKTTGPCPGYHMDHTKALMNRGKDDPKNMQWLSESAHREKTKKDYAQCMDSIRCKNKRVAKRAPWEKPKTTKRSKKKAKA